MRTTNVVVDSLEECLQKFEVTGKHLIILFEGLEEPTILVFISLKKNYSFKIVFIKLTLVVLVLRHKYNASRL